MKPVYSPSDINNFEVTPEQKIFIANNHFTKPKLVSYLRKLKKDYYKKCTPIGFI
jgi:nicotinic acid phosphoribosyltransferase